MNFKLDYSLGGYRLWLNGEVVFTTTDKRLARLFYMAPEMLQVASGALGYLEALPKDCRPDDSWLKPLREAISKTNPETWA